MADDITLREGQPIDTDIMLYSVWISPGNPAYPGPTVTDIYLYDPTTLMAGGGATAGSVIHEAETGDPFLVINDKFITRTEGAF